MTERTFTESEVNATLALFAQQVAEHCLTRTWFGEDTCTFECTCGLKMEPNAKSIRQQWGEHILTLADPSALAAHDAALRQTIFEYEIPKLEADNARLREALRQWMCPQCGGTKIFKGYSKGKVFTDVDAQPCRYCKDTDGLHPKAHGALLATRKLAEPPETQGKETT